jgi:hypothetical protein
MNQPVCDKRIGPFATQELLDRALAASNKSRRELRFERELRKFSVGKFRFPVRPASHWTQAGKP